MHLDRNSTVTVIAGTGEEGNRNGSNSFAAFGQSMNLCLEGDNIFLRDAQIGTIKLVIKSPGQYSFWKILGSSTVPFLCTSKTARLKGTQSRW